LLYWPSSGNHRCDSEPRRLPNRRAEAVPRSREFEIYAAEFERSRRHDIERRLRGLLKRREIEMAREPSIASRQVINKDGALTITSSKD
jgi:hypothetical protein